MTSVSRRTKRMLLWVLAVVGSIFGVMMLGGAAGVFWWWGVGFDEAEKFGVASPSTDAAMVASFWVALAGVVGLAATGALAAFVATRNPVNQHQMRVTPGVGSSVTSA